MSTVNIARVVSILGSSYKVVTQRNNDIQVNIDLASFGRDDDAKIELLQAGQAKLKEAGITAKLNLSHPSGQRGADNKIIYSSWPCLIIENSGSGSVDTKVLEDNARLKALLAIAKAGATPEQMAAAEAAFVEAKPATTETTEDAPV